MLFNNVTQFAVLLLVLIVGWLFGFASHPGGKKWKQSYRDEQEAHAADVTERDARIRELETRDRELTGELDRTRTTVPVAAPVAAAGAAAVAADATPARKRGWFDWGGGDDLTRLRGVDADVSRRLKAEGVDSFAELANLTDQDEIALEQRIALPAGYIQREQLREQARLLADGDADRHASTFG